MYKHGWEDAGQIAKAHASVFGDLQRLEPKLGTRYLFKIGGDDRYTVLVHRGRILAARGMMEFVNYLRDIDFLRTRHLGADQLTALWRHFAQLKSEQYTGRPTVVALSSGFGAAMAPLLTFDTSGAKLRVTYWRRFAPGTVDADQWTMHISNNYRVTWSKGCARFVPISKKKRSGWMFKPCLQQAAEPVVRPIRVQKLTDE